jgi:hypothetical protein
MAKMDEIEAALTDAVALIRKGPEGEPALCVLASVKAMTDL